MFEKSTTHFFLSFSHLTKKIKPSDFTDKYLKIDEDFDYILKKVPCEFLLKDNSCSIYDFRPKACREYPQIGLHRLDAEEVRSCGHAAEDQEAAQKARVSTGQAEGGSAYSD